MSDRKWYLSDDMQPTLRMWIFTQMTVGAIYAAVLFFGVIAFVMILRLVAGWLPEDPYAMLEIGRAATAAA